MDNSLNKEMLRELQLELHYCNPFVHLFKFARTGEQEINEEVLYITIHNTHGKDMRQYNAPRSNEIALIHTSFENEPKKRDIIIKRYDNTLIRISELHGAYDPLQYPLLFPIGEYGWHKGILRANIQQEEVDESDEENIEYEEEEIGSEVVVEQEEEEQVVKQDKGKKVVEYQEEELEEQLYLTEEEVQQIKLRQQQKLKCSTTKYNF
jgi:hypothetical protein